MGQEILIEKMKKNNKKTKQLDKWIEVWIWF